MRHALLALPLVLLAGCAGAAATPAKPPCKQLPEAVLPRTAGTLSEAESGSFCLAPGEQLSIFLKADGAGWARATSSDPKVLVPTSTSMMTAPIGVTPGMFRALARGTAELASQDAAGKSWRVTIVVN